MRGRSLGSMGLARIGIAGAAGLASAWLWDSVPDPMPIHWGLDGRPDGWAPKIVGLLLLPVTALAMPAMISFFARRDREMPESARGALERTLTTMAALLAGVHLLVLDAALAEDQVIRMGAVAALLGAMQIAIGLEMPRTEPNRWIGIRMRATMESPAIWKAAHAFAGRAFVASGVIAILGSLALAPSSAALLAIAAVVVSAIAATLFAWSLGRARR